MRVTTVVGNRPQFVKAAAVSKPLRKHHQEFLIHTGQHYDDALSAVFFRELDLPAPDLELNLGGGTNLQQTSRMIAELEQLVKKSRPDAVLVYGDTNTTLAAALVAADLQVPLVHVEAGMRSFDRAMPEERNRVVTDHLSSLLLAPTEVAIRNLAAEGLADKSIMVGDVMTDVSLMMQPAAVARTETWWDKHGLEFAGKACELPEPNEFLLCTSHRQANVDDEYSLSKLVDLLLKVSLEVGPVVFPVHPRTLDRLTRFGLLEQLVASDRIVLTQPVGPLDFATLLVNSKAVLTDSGGVQKEAYLAAKRCVTLRDTTEWVETVETGWNTLVALDAAKAISGLKLPVPAERPAIFGAGDSGQRVADSLSQLYK